MRVLIFGGTPLANRLAYYIMAYSEVKDIATTVIRRELDSTTTLNIVQQNVWNTYVSDTQGRTDLIINAHEEGRLKICETDPTVAWRTNTRHAAWIAYAARTANVPLIHWSSDHVFRGASGPYSHDRETSSETPMNVYGVTKLYAEQFVQHLYPKRTLGQEFDALNPGTTIVRTSGLYGADVPDSLPAILTHEEKTASGTEFHTHGIVRNKAKISPSFIGEVAFLFARNLLLSPQSLNEPVIHIAPGWGVTTWAEYLHNLGCDISFQEVGERQKRDFAPNEHLQRQGQLRGLTPTPGWFLPSDPQKSWTDFKSEYESGGKWKYVRYWNAE